MTNFKFLKDIDKDLYDIAREAENLYRDEYFEQCITQTRKFGENICKKVVKNNCRPNDTFDEMLAVLKDMSHGTPREKEFLDDLYFLKKSGNTAVHSSRTEHSGIKALTCLQRAFEAAVNFAAAQPGYDSKTENLVYDEELLITGKKSRSKTLQEKYLEEKKKELKKTSKTKGQTSKTKNPVKKRQYSVTKKKNGKKFPFFKVILIFSSIIAAITLVVVMLL